MLLEIVASVAMFASVRREVDWSWLRPITIGLLIGTPVGVGLLAFLPENITRGLIYGGLLLASAMAWRGGVRRRIPNWQVGLLAGLGNGLAAIAGLIAALFFLVSERDGARMRASLIALFFVSDLYAIAWGGGFGLLTDGTVFQFAAWFVLPLFAGIGIGAFVFRRWGAGYYRKAALSLIFLAAIGGVVRWLLA